MSCLKPFIFGGAFNPPTLAHFNSVLNLRLLYPDTPVIIVPSCDSNPENKSLAPFDYRFKLLQKTFSSVPFVSISRVAAYLSPEYKGRLYHLREILPTKAIHVIGVDQLLNINTWFNADKLKQECEFLILPRTGYSLTSNSLEGFTNTTVLSPKLLPLPHNKEISSTQLRVNLTNKLDVTGLIPYNITLTDLQYYTT